MRCSGNFWRDKAALLACAAALLGTLSWTTGANTPVSGRTAARHGAATLTLRGGGQPIGDAAAVPQSITLLDDGVAGGNKIDGVVRIISRVSGVNAVKLHTDRPDLLKPPCDGGWPCTVPIPAGTEAAFEIETNVVTAPTEVRLFACKSNVADADCQADTSDTLVTFTVLPQRARPAPPRGGRTPHRVQPIPISLSASNKAVLGGVVGFDLTAHLLIQVGDADSGAGATPVTATTPATPGGTAETSASSESLPAGSAGSGGATPAPNVYEVDTNQRALLISPKAGGGWPVQRKFEGVFNSLLHIKTRSPQQAGGTGPMYVKIFARRPGAPKTAIVTILVQ